MWANRYQNIGSRPRCAMAPLWYPRGGDKWGIEATGSPEWSTCSGSLKRERFSPRVRLYKYITISHCTKSRWMRRVWATNNASHHAPSNHHAYSCFYLHPRIGLHGSHSLGVHAGSCFTPSPAGRPVQAPVPLARETHFSDTVATLCRMLSQCSPVRAVQQCGWKLLCGRQPMY